MIDTLIQDAPFMNFLAITAVALIGAWSGIQIKKLDKKNTAQHEQGRTERSESEDKILGRLDEVHSDVIVTNVRVGEIKGALEAHVKDANVHGTKPS